MRLIVRQNVTKGHYRITGFRNEAWRLIKRHNRFDIYGETDQAFGEFLVEKHTSPQALPSVWVQKLDSIYETRLDKALAEIQSWVTEDQKENPKAYA
tara:strand:+ start:198 stop:488 length:291 start_codon:yes stop_codon:yes gene_type:complete